MIHTAVAPSTSLLLYLHADQVVRPANALTGTHVPGIEARVNLNDLAATIVAAAFWRLREDGLIALDVIKKKILFVIPATEVRATLLATGGRGGLEGDLLTILGTMQGQGAVSQVVRAWFGEDIPDPHLRVCRQMDGEALQAGCYVERSAERGLVAGLIKGQTTLEPMAERIAACDEQAREVIAWWQQARTAEPLLFKEVFNACGNAVTSRKESDSSDIGDALDSFSSSFD